MPYSSRSRRGIGDALRREGPGHDGDLAGLSPADGTAAKLREQIHATKEALSALETDLAAREASLRRAEEAGQTFIREREMREAIRVPGRAVSRARRARLPRVRARLRRVPGRAVSRVVPSPASCRLSSAA